ncbi:MAG: T9SS type A sorting domain-containing protein [Bacteroidia bacterium]
MSYDAYGTLLIPYGTIQNVMRFHTLDTLFDSGFMVTFDTYDWWDSTSQIPLLTISDLWSTGSNVMKRVYYPQATSILASSENRLPSPAVTVYPNPVHNQLRLDTPSEWLGAGFGLYSSTGQLIVATELPDLHVTVDVSTLASGFYFYRVTDSASSLLQTGKIVVE